MDSTFHKKVMQSCGLHTLPDRRTFDRRFKVLPVNHMISQMGTRFVLQSLVDCTVTAVDSMTIRARGPVRHKRHIKSGTTPRPRIDTDARCGFAATKGWLFEYKLHISCSTGRLVVPLSSGVSSANVYDNQMYRSIVESLPHTIRYVVADGEYDDHRLYDYTRQRNARLVCPIRRYRHTKGQRPELIRFYRSRFGQKTYQNRSVSVEPLI